MLTYSSQMHITRDFPSPIISLHAAYYKTPNLILQAIGRNNLLKAFKRNKGMG